ncbi:hypothetical protein CVT24_006568 [Panaeolus cyanescens]|uniref:F-box domain-containing protein n=1 Tax=Panaeolus cyanescens TaxID=181874 RepID=A0A409WNV5_9AGAR|nr:hypothetical protein CVT24_006568 [Panaeolus cyanescens]
MDTHLESTTSNSTARLTVTEASPILPPELITHIFSYLHFSALVRASGVCKSWRNYINTDTRLWRGLLETNNMWYGGASETAFVNSINARHHRAQKFKNDREHGALSSFINAGAPNPYKMLFRSRYITRTRYAKTEPKHTTIPAHGTSFITCLIISRDRVISASEQSLILVHSLSTGELLHTLEGHEGGVWSLVLHNDTLVSGSTDRTIRVWDLRSGACTHVFGGHTSTVRCLVLVRPAIQMLETKVQWGGEKKGPRFPKRPLILSGGRDSSLRVWKLPRLGDLESEILAEDTDSGGILEAWVPEDNPYHKFHLTGHGDAIRAIAARGRTAVSGSYDCTVGVWDIATGKRKWALVGHTQKVYSVAIDDDCHQAASGSMDGTVRLWNLHNGQCAHVLSGHTSLVGLLAVSHSHLVSASADSLLRIWDPNEGVLKKALIGHTGAITCFQHDGFKIISGSDGALKMWDISNIGHGAATLDNSDEVPVRDLLTGAAGVYQVAFEGKWCCAAIINRQDESFINVWDFGDEADDEEDWIAETMGAAFDGDDLLGEEDEEVMDSN